MFFSYTPKKSRNSICQMNCQMIFLGLIFSGLQLLSQSSFAQSLSDLAVPILDFQKARSLELQSEKGPACELYKDIQKKLNAFKTKNSAAFLNLQTLAQIREVITCKHLQKIEFSGDQMTWLAPWIKDFAKTQEQEAKDSKTRLNALLLLSKIKDEQKERLAALDQAFSLTQKADKEWGKTLQETIQDQREKIAPRFIKNIKLEELPNLAPMIISDFFESLEYENARGWITTQLKLKNLPQELEYRLRLAMAQSYKREQKKKQNLKALKELHQWQLKKNLPVENFQEAISLYARALWTIGDRKSGEALLKKHLARLEKLKDDPKELAATFHWILGRMYEEDKAYQKSNEWLSKGIMKAAQGSDLQEKLTFMRAWNLKKLNDFSGARKDLESLLALDRKPSEKARYEFWLGWMMEKEGNKEKAVSHFEKAAELEPFSYYAVLSHIHRKMDFPPLWSGQNHDQRKHEDLKPAPTPRAPQDEVLGLLEELREEELIKFYSEFKLLETNLSTQSSLYLAYAEAHSKVSGHLPLFRAFNLMSNEERLRFFRASPEMIFPLKHYSLIRAEAQKRNLPEDFVLSIIRQESTFDPKARSPADAMGLMQVLASLGGSLGKRAGVQFSTYEDLFKPEVNVPIGTLLLADLYKKFPQNFILTAASYNANPVAVKRWIRARNDQSFIEFMEEVPYEETRTYMKLILRNFVFYRRLKNPTSSTLLPEECLTSLQFPKLSTGGKKKK